MVRTESAAVSEAAYTRFAAERVPLERLLLVSSGTPSLSIAVCNSPAVREALLDSLIDSTGAIRSDVTDDVPANYFETLERQIHDTAPTALFITGVGEGSDHRQWLNRGRERWGALFAGPVIFWASDSIATAWLKGAPDFWAWVSHQFDFTTPEGESPDVPPRTPESRDGRPGLWSSRNVEAKRERLRELGGRLAELETNWCDDPEVANVAERWWLERLDILEDMGRLDEVVSHASELLSRPETRATLQCRLLLQRSRVFRTTGRLEEASDDLRTAKSMAERIERPALLASAYGQIADILQARGELDEALRIRQEQEVPVYERLGDVRSLAITRGQIADILQARGELDEALRRWREQLPVFERLREAPTIAIVKARIAALERRLDHLATSDR